MDSEQEALVLQGGKAGQVWEWRRAGREDCRGRNAAEDWRNEEAEEGRSVVVVEEELRSYERRAVYWNLRALGVQKYF